MISIIVLFIDKAPWLPPNTKTSGMSLSNPYSSFLCSISSVVKSNFLTLVGVPVTTTFVPFGSLSFASLNPTKTLLCLLFLLAILLQHLAIHYFHVLYKEYAISVLPLAQKHKYIHQYQLLCLA